MRAGRQGAEVNIPIAFGIACISVGIILLAVQTYNSWTCDTPFCTSPWSTYIIFDLPLVLIGAVFVAVSFLFHRKPATSS